MIAGWRGLLIGQKRKSSQNSEGFVMVRSTRVSLGDELGKSSGKDSGRLAGVLPSPGGSQTHLQMPEPGDVTKRHETMDFSALEDVDLDRPKRRIRGEEEV